MESKKYILAVHHDADLYGSDKSFLRTLRALKGTEFNSIVVVPHNGPLVSLLRDEGIEVHIGPVGKLTRQLLKPWALHLVLRDMFSSVQFIGRVVNGRPIALTYSNSVAALGGGVWAKLRGVRRLWHVREIVVSPRVAAVGFPRMLELIGGWCVCNSKATRGWIVSTRPQLEKCSSVIWNGLEDQPDVNLNDTERFRSDLGLGEGDILVALVGRINRWKGQGVLIEAASILRARGYSNIRFVIVGDVADGQHHFREKMLEDIRDYGLIDVVHWLPFTHNINVVWAATDIATVPSVEPEPFGRVAIEAMAHGLPVIASGQGGLAEIVVPGETGLLVPPGDGTRLADAIASLADDAQLRRSFGEAGRLRQKSFFSQSEHDKKMLMLMTELVA